MARKQVEHTCFTKIEQSDSLGNEYPWSLHWRVVMLNTAFQCSIWPPFTNRFRNCPTVLST